MGAVAGALFLELLLLLLMCFFMLFNVKLEEAGSWGLNEGSCGSLKPIVVVCCFTYIWVSLLSLKLFTAQSWLKDWGLNGESCIIFILRVVIVINMVFSFECC